MGKLNLIKYLTIGLLTITSNLSAALLQISSDNYKLNPMTLEWDMYHPLEEDLLHDNTNYSLASSSNSYASTSTISNINIRLANLDISTANLTSQIISLSTTTINSRLDSLDNSTMTLTNRLNNLDSSATNYVDVSSNTQTKVGGFNTLGWIGIGTNNPVSPLAIVGTGGGAFQNLPDGFYMGGDGTNNHLEIVSGSNQPYIDLSNSNSVDYTARLIVLSSGANGLALYVSGSEVFRGSDLGGGSLGIGTDSPSSRLDILNGSITIRGTNAGINVVGGTVQSDYFVGDGSNLVNIATGTLVTRLNNLDNSTSTLKLLASNTNYLQILGSTITGNYVYIENQPLFASSQTSNILWGRSELNPGLDSSLNNFGSIWNTKSFTLSWTGIAVSADGQYQTAVANSTTIYTSSDYGQTWNTRDASRTWAAVAMSASGQYQTATGLNLQLYISSNYGVTWVAKNSSRQWTSVAISASGQYQSATDSSSNIYVSSDYGQTWTAKGPGTGWQSIAMSASGKYQAIGQPIAGAVYLSSDYGQTWATSNSPNLVGYGIAMSANGQYITTGDENGGSLYVSSDYGNSWTTVSMSNYWFSFSMSGNGQYQIGVDWNAGSAGSLYSSTDYGRTWSALSPSAIWESVSMSADAKYISAVGTNSKIYKSVTEKNTFLSGITAISFSGDGSGLTNIATGTMITRLNNLDSSTSTLTIAINNLNVSTANYVDTSGSTQTKTGGFNVVGNVGIGTTTTPTVKLQIVGNVNIVSDTDAGSSINSGSLRMTNTAGTGAVVLDANEIQSEGTNNPLYVNYDSGNSTILNGGGTGNLGIGTAFATPSSKLDILNGSITVRGTNSGINVVGGTVYSNYFVGDGSNLINIATGALVTRVSNLENSVTNYIDTSGSTQTKTGGINTYGMMGMGNNSPSSMLDILNGSITVRGTNAGMNIVGSGDGNMSLYDSNSSSRVFITSNGNSWFNGGSLGLGTTAPNVLLDILAPSGRVNILNISTGSTRILDVTGSSMTIYGYLTVSSNAYKPGGGSWAATSDVRIKKNVVSIDDALLQLEKLHGVRYEWINPKEHNNQKKVQGGFLAQEVEKVFPDWVTEIKASGKDKSLTNDGNIKTISLPFEFDALLVEAIKELGNQNKYLLSKIDFLERDKDLLYKLERSVGELVNQNKILKEKNEELERRLRRKKK